MCIRDSVGIDAARGGHALWQQRCHRETYGPAEEVTTIHTTEDRTLARTADDAQRQRRDSQRFREISQDGGIPRRAARLAFQAGDGGSSPTGWRGPAGSTRGLGE